MRKKKRAQVSFEYLLVFIMAALLAIPAIALYQDYKKSSKKEIAVSRTKTALLAIEDYAQKVYYMGPPSKTKLKVMLPEEIINSTVEDNRIAFYLENRDLSVSTVSEINMSGSLPENGGLYEIIIEAREGFVWLEPR